MSNPWLHRYAIFFAVCVLILIVGGAAVTTGQSGLPTASQTASSNPPAAQARDSARLEDLHRMAAMIVLALTVGLAIWLSVADKRGWLRGFGWIALATVLVEAGLGQWATSPSTAAVVRFLHAYCAQLFFSIAVAVAVFTSPGWRRGPDAVPDRLALRALAIGAPALVLLQVGLGAAYRHKAMGVASHIFGAMIVAVFVLLVGVLACKQCPGHRAVRPAAVVLMSVTGLQVVLGFAAFVIRLLTTQVTPPVMISTVAHVATGSMTLAASFVLALQIRRHVEPAAAAQPEPETDAASAAS